MTRGGKRPGAGRPKGAVNRMTEMAREKAAATGLLPHEFLLAVSRGEVVDDHMPTFEERIDAAKAAAPYFAPKLANIDMKAEHDVADRVADLMRVLDGRTRGLPTGA